MSKIFFKTALLDKLRLYKWGPSLMNSKIELLSFNDFFNNNNNNNNKIVINVWLLFIVKQFNTCSSWLSNIYFNFEASQFNYFSKTINFLCLIFNFWYFFVVEACLWTIIVGFVCEYVCFFYSKIKFSDHPLSWTSLETCFISLLIVMQRFSWEL